MEFAESFGVKALELYIPNHYVKQDALELHDGVSAGKYTIGLGQTKMGVCSDREDPYSIALTTVDALLKKNNIDPVRVGRLEVGTETVIDKSKSIKTVLMQLFEPHGNTDIEGVDTINACYGGTNALFNCLNWLRSPYWDGRDAIVVAVDIAVYEKGPARPTGGAGCVAMLLGPNAPLVFEDVRSTHMIHAYDFYKANLFSEYPLVDGKLSLQCYAEALRRVYLGFQQKQKTQGQSSYTDGLPSPASSDKNASLDAQLPIDSFDYFLFHAPTSKTVMKSYAKMMQEDYKQMPSHEAWKDLSAEQLTMLETAEPDSKEVESIFLKLTKHRFDARVSPSLLVARENGNMYTASLYSGLCSLLSGIDVSAEDLVGSRVGLFSYGSGLAASMFSLRVSSTAQTAEALRSFAHQLDVKNKLESRIEVSPVEYERFIALREASFSKNNHTPQGPVDELRQGTWYLQGVDDAFRRTYAVR